MNVETDRQYLDRIRDAAADRVGLDTAIGGLEPSEVIRAQPGQPAAGAADVTETPGGCQR